MLIRRMVVSWLTLALLLQPAFPAIAANEAKEPECAVCPAALAGGAEVGSTQGQSDRVHVAEFVKGRKARAHLQPILQDHPQREALSRASLRKIGAKPTDHVVGIEYKRLQRAELMAQDHALHEPEGSIYLWTWDDGDDSTWEGKIIVVTSDGGIYKMTSQWLLQHPLTAVWTNFYFGRHPNGEMIMVDAVHSELKLQLASLGLSGVDGSQTHTDCLGEYLDCISNVFDAAVIGCLASLYAGGPAAYIECLFLVISAGSAICQILFFWCLYSLPTE